MLPDRVSNPGPVSCPTDCATWPGSTTCKWTLKHTYTLRCYILGDHLKFKSVTIDACKQLKPRSAFTFCLCVFFHFIISNSSVRDSSLNDTASPTTTIIFDFVHIILRFIPSNDNPLKILVDPILSWLGLGKWHRIAFGEQHF